MKKTLLTFTVIAVMAASLSSCGRQAAKRTNSGSSLTTLQAMNDTTKIGIDTDIIDSVKLLFGEGVGDHIDMQESDYAAFTGFLSTAFYDTAWNDSGIMVKMIAPDYTAVISYQNKPAEDNDWIMIWKDNGRAKFRQKWFFIAEDKREELYGLLENYRQVDKSIEMTVFPQRNGGAPQTLELTVQNNTGEMIQFGADYSIERLVDGKWTEVDLGNFAVIAIMYGVQPGGSGKYTVNLFTDRVEYPEGEYRVVKLINTGGSDALPYYANFKIIEPR